MARRIARRIYRSRSFTGLSLVLACFSVSGDKPFRYFDWASSDLGTVSKWSQSVRTAVEACASMASGLPRLPTGARHAHDAVGPRAPLGDHRSSAPSPTFSFRKDGRATPVRVDSQLAITISEGATASAVAGLTASSENSARAELETGQLVRVLPDRDFGSMEVNALFVSGKTIKPAARAFADFLLRELRAA
jgi:DNA-binding transcriptional LysR family regulator